jgi:hypothetical protein
MWKAQEHLAEPKGARRGNLNFKIVTSFPELEKNSDIDLSP